MQVLQAVMDISGPEFLLQYAVLIAILCLALHLRKSAFLAQQHSHKADPPGIRADPVCLAYISGGAMQVYYTVGVHLLETGSLFIDNAARISTAGGVRRTISVPGDFGKKYHDVYEATHSYCQSRRKLLSPSGRFLDKIKKICESRLTSECFEAGLITSPHQRRMMYLYCIAAQIVLVAALALRLYTASLQHHHNISLMILMCIVACCSLPIIANLPVATNRGRELLRMITRLAAPSTLHARVAVSGIAAVVGTEFSMLYRPGIAVGTGGGCGGGACNGGGGGGCGGGACGG